MGVDGNGDGMGGQGVVVKAFGADHLSLGPLHLDLEHADVGVEEGVGVEDVDTELEDREAVVDIHNIPGVEVDKVGKDHVDLAGVDTFWDHDVLVVGEQLVHVPFAVASIVYGHSDQLS